MIDAPQIGCSFTNCCLDVLKQRICTSTIYIKLHCVVCFLTSAARGGCTSNDPFSARLSLLHTTRLREYPMCRWSNSYWASLALQGYPSCLRLSNGRYDPAVELDCPRYTKPLP